MKMTDEERQEVADCIDQEGFNYAFLNYSKFEEIEDPEFHRLRLAYIAAESALSSYISGD